MKCPFVTFWIALALFSQAQAFCGSRMLQTSLTRAAFRAAEWLRNQQDENGTYGEGHASAIAYHSLRLIGNNVERGARHLKAEIMKNKLGSISGSRVAYYILGAISTCRDPKDFYSLNLLRTLQTKLGKYPAQHDFSHPFQYSLAVLALCTGGAKTLTFVERITKSILGRQSASMDYMNEDTLAMQVLALSCIQGSMKRKGTKSMKIKMKLNINRAVDRASKKLRRRQMNDSTFGQNEVTAALAAQALLAGNVTTIKCPETMSWLLSRQNSNGSFINLLSTITVLPSMIGALPYDVQHIPCPKNTSGSVVENKDEMINVCVELQIDVEDFSEQSKPVAKNTYPQQRTPKPLPPSACVEVKNGTNAHDILKEAAKQHTCYKLTTTNTTFGHMIKSICGLEQKPAEKFFWMIYMNDKAAQVGIDGLRPKNDSTLRFHYKKVNWG